MSSETFIIAGITLLGGIFLFILQQIIEKSFFKPLQKQKDTIEDIATLLIQYSSLYTNPTNYGGEHFDNLIRKKYSDASNKTRELASLLKVRSDNIPLYNFWVKIYNIIPRKNIGNAFSKLIGLSNSYGNVGHGIENSDLADEIRNLLKIPSVN